MNGKVFKVGDAVSRFLEQKIVDPSDITFALHDVQFEQSLKKNFIIFPADQKIIERQNGNASFLINHIKQIYFKDFSADEKENNKLRYASISLDQVKLFGNFKIYTNGYPQEFIDESSIPPNIQDIIKTTFSKQGETAWEVPSLGKGHRRTSPSNGGRHPIELYVLSNNNEGIHNAIFHVGSLDQKLTLIAREGVDYILDEILSVPNTSPFFCLFYVASFPRSQLRYNESRSLLSIFLDCGHLIGTVDMLANFYGFEHTDALLSPQSFQRITRLSPAYEGIIHATILRDSEYTNNFFQTDSRFPDFSLPRAISLSHDFKVWEKAGWIGAIYIYTTYISIMEQLFDCKMQLPTSITRTKRDIPIDIKKYLHERKTYRNFGRTLNLTSLEIEKFILKALSQFSLENVMLLVAFNTEKDKRVVVFKYDFTNKTLDFLSQNIPFDYICDEFDGQLDCRNFIVSFHFFYVTSGISEKLCTDSHVLLTLMQIGNIAQNLIIYGMSLQLGSFMSHAARQSTPLSKIEIVNDNCTLLYSIVMGALE